VLVVEQRAKAVLAISDYTYVLGGGQVLMEGTPARLAASQEFTESFFGAVPPDAEIIQLVGEPRPGNDLGLRRCTGTAARAWRSTARPAGLGTRSPCRSPEDAELIRFGPTLTGAGRRPMRSSGWLAQGGLRVS
jgi:hypothetical protein